MRPISASHLRSRAAAAVALAAVARFAAAGPAVAAGGSGSTVGGASLAGRGIAVGSAPGTPPLPAHITAHSWLVADLQSGQVLAARGAHVKHLPASTLKTLTALTLIPRLPAGMTWRTTNRDASVDGTRVGLVPGRRYTVGKLFQAMLMVSANDAADALAQANGGFAKTLREMNAEAAHLQADDTHAVTPSGLDGNGESISAYDLALIARAAWRLPAFRDYVHTVKSRMPAPHHKHYQIFTHNYLLTTYRGDLGGKNGYTVAAHATYWTIARRHGHTVLVTLMDANPDFWPDARALLGWGFKADGRAQPVGRLVGPRRAAPPPAASGVHVASLGGPSASGSRPVLTTGRECELGLLGGSLVVLAAVLVRRRYGGRSRSRLTLPRI
jgi:D-alanyl-D-alanine carboxypeptidase (penicillin-binding protein 5/6)